MGLNIGFNIRNPLFKGNDTFKELFSREKKISKHKFFSINVEKSRTTDLIEFNLSGCLNGQDHAGIEISGRIGSFFASFELRDSRHWNYEQNCWMMDVNSWFGEFQKYVYKVNKGAVVHQNNVMDYYNDQLMPSEAFDQFMEDNDGVKAFLAHSKSCIIPGRFVKTSDLEQGVDVYIHTDALKFFDAKYMDVTKDGNLVNVRFIDFQITNNDIHSDYMGHSEKYDNYVKLDRDHVMSFDIVIDPDTFRPIFSIILKKDAPNFDYNSVVSTSIGHERIQVRRSGANYNMTGYLPEIYYKV